MNKTRVISTERKDAARRVMKKEVDDGYPLSSATANERVLRYQIRLFSNLPAHPARCSIVAIWHIIVHYVLIVEDVNRRRVRIKERPRR